MSGHRLNRDFSQSTGSDAPYALVLPGFVKIDWSNAAADLANDIVFAHHHTTPLNLGNRIAAYWQSGPTMMVTAIGDGEVFRG